MKDILLIISDQHSYSIQGYAGNNIIRTPNLDRLASEGVVMTDAYTSCPLCVPARMSFLSGQLPSSTGVLGNMTSLSSNIATYVHSLASIGYETVLCGRMHFVGPDQRHGFSKRIAKETTPLYHNRPASLAEERKDFAITFAEFGAIRYMGAGSSPTLEYDRYVFEEALKYLDEDHEKPQFLCVGTYSPHFPYIAPPDLYDYYYDRVPMPDDTFEYDEHPIFTNKLRDTDPEVVRAARAAYYGMTEFLDINIGLVVEKWNEFLVRNGRQGIIIYVSDHGDQNGERGFYGKTTFYEASAHIPMLITGSGIPAGKTIDTPTSIMDLGPTICELVEAPIPPDQEGKSLMPQIVGDSADEDRAVISELLLGSGDNRSLGRMVKWRNYKFITFSGYEKHDQLFDLEQDPLELENVISRHPEIAERLRKIADVKKPPSVVFKEQKTLDKHREILSKCTFDSDERWRCNEAAVQPPLRLTKSKQPFPNREKIGQMMSMILEK
ncbi:MAG: sulfatase-like hydrolase/transferase [Eubacteriales bacterium]